MTMPNGFKPMLAGKVTKPEQLKFPAYVSPKIDGIRCTNFGGVGYSRSGKEFPNTLIRQALLCHGDDLDFMDGELVVGSPTDANCMQNTSSVVMSIEKKEAFTFYAFDLVNTSPFVERMEQLTSYYLKYADASTTGRMGFVKLVPQYRVNSVEEVDMHEAEFCEQGYEGLMYRAEGGAYKFGRSTEREGYLLKVKRMDDAEAIVIGYEQEVDKYGRPKGTLGALICRRLEDNVEFSVGSGFTLNDRQTLWYLRDQLVGRMITYKFFNHGIRVAPRHPVFKGFRDEVDMDPRS